MKKIYEAPGMMEWYPEIAVGRGRVKLSFEGGHFSGRGHTPATFETSDPAVQTLIENSSPFKIGKIRLAAGFKRGIMISEPAATAVEEGRKPLKEKAFDNLAEAIDFLTVDMKIPASEVMGPEECVKAAERIGIKLKIKK